MKYIFSIRGKVWRNRGYYKKSLDRLNKKGFISIFQFGKSHICFLHMIRKIQWLKEVPTMNFVSKNKKIFFRIATYKINKKCKMKKRAHNLTSFYTTKKRTRYLNPFLILKRKKVFKDLSTYSRHLSTLTKHWPREFQTLAHMLHQRMWCSGIGCGYNSVARLVSCDVNRVTSVAFKQCALDAEARTMAYRWTRSMHLWAVLELFE